MSRTARLFQLMQTLRNLPSPTTAERLADEVGVSLRTIYRDVDTLRGLGAVIDGAAGFGFTLIEDASLPPLGFDEEEIEALVVGLREVMAVGDPGLVTAAQNAMAKLRARLPEKQAHRLEHAVLTAQRMDRPPSPGIDARELRRAAWEERTITFDYCDAHGAETQRSVDPLAIVFLQASHCLMARCHLRNDYRVFRLDRMENLTMTDRSFRPHRIPMLREFSERLRSQKQE